jgi:hypothetical protein
LGGTSITSNPKWAGSELPRADALAAGLRRGWRSSSAQAELGLSALWGKVLRERPGTKLSWSQVKEVLAPSGVPKVHRRIQENPSGPGSASGT